MTTYTVNMDNVAAIAEEMGAIANYIQGLIEDLDNGTRQNLAEWTSVCQTVYANTKASWDTAAQDMAFQATQAQNSLGQITDAYANAEYQGMGLWS